MVSHDQRMIGIVRIYRDIFNKLQQEQRDLDESIKTISKI